ncbi:MAG TPA: flippase-like domain-containing protein [Mycobacteriales bacterium]|nr:flippase-like domain-containing protein [Mycobacteriales bacterium]
MTRRGPRWVIAALALPAAVGVLAVVLPKMTGTAWDDMTDRVAGVPLPQIWQLTAVWAGGLWLHTFVLRASLPGLRTRQALALNLGGSSVSNVLPLGGAAGVGLNYAMLRSWGYSRTQISSFTALSNLVVAVVKTAIALAGLVTLALMPSVAAGVALPPRRMGLIVLSAVIVLVAATLLAGRSRWGRGRLTTATAALRQTVAMGAEALRRGWRQITVGGVGYPALQALLLWLCLTSVDARVTPVAALVTYAVERLMTLVPLTPGGLGFVETAATATLVAFGADPAAAAAGVILFRVFSYLVEIPLGGVIAMVWLARRRRAVATAA